MLAMMRDDDVVAARKAQSPSFSRFYAHAASANAIIDITPHYTYDDIHDYYYAGASLR